MKTQRVVIKIGNVAREVEIALGSSGIWETTTERVCVRNRTGKTRANKTLKVTQNADGTWSPCSPVYLNRPAYIVGWSK